jgi:hypothetical protein
MKQAQIKKGAGFRLCPLYLFNLGKQCILTRGYVMKTQVNRKNLALIKQNISLWLGRGSMGIYGRFLVYQ